MSLKLTDVGIPENYMWVRNSPRFGGRLLYFTIFSSYKEFPHAEEFAENKRVFLP